ncbi:MAG: lipocalin-like domain-containing protein [Burkholderiales bacterium]|nr:lipocalin-like domain-containing protein [Anaerolineae bacterium]
MSESKETFVGAWKLVSVEFHDTTNGGVRTAAANGRLMYDEQGNMSAQMFYPGRPMFASNDAFKPTPEEAVAAFSGSTAYFGTYSVDNEGQTIIHHVEDSVYPNYIGQHLRRKFRFDGERVTFSTEPVILDGQQVIVSLTWERIAS